MNNSKANGTITVPAGFDTPEVIIHQLIPLTDPVLEKTMVTGSGRYLMNFLLESCQVLPFDDFKLYKTKDYHSFSHLQGNRDIKEQHVHALMNSFSKDGYLFTIIYVNERIEIVDGQHRFEAAKRKHLPIYFIVAPGWGIKEVTVLNVNSMNWTMEDFMNTHAGNGNKSYIMFKEFFDSQPFDITTAQMILLGRRVKQGGTNDDFRTGKMILTKEELEKGFAKARKISDFQQFHPNGWKSRNFVETMLYFFKVKGFDHKHLVEQLKKYPELMLSEARSLRPEEYQKMLVEKYNHRKREKIELP